MNDGCAANVAGSVIATDGGRVGSGVVTVTFDAPYAGTPVVVVVPANGLAAGSNWYVSNVTTNSFDITVAATSGNGTDTYAFNHLVVETD